MPSGLQSLATLGKLYESEGGFSKIVNFQEYKEKRKIKKQKMNGLLKRRQKSF
jgi:hypothetical protein